MCLMKRFFFHEAAWQGAKFGCPRCEAGVLARREAWERAPFESLTAAVLPIVVIGIVVLLLERVGKDEP